MKRQCELVGISRSGFYYEARGESAENLELMRRIDDYYTRWPFYGIRRMTAVLRREGVLVNPKRVARLMGLMGLEAIYPKRRLSKPAAGHHIYPYLLRGAQITRPDQVWSADITYLPLRGGWAYLVAVIDWFSRYVLSWEVSVSLEADFCVSALSWALRRGCPEIFNTDQGSQFTSADFTQPLLDAGVRISMDGRGRALDNVFTERLWRSVKWEDIYLQDYESPGAVITGLGSYFPFYNEERPHQALSYRTPGEVYREARLLLGTG